MSTLLFLALAVAAEPTPPVAHLDLAHALVRFHEASPVIRALDGRVAEARAGARLAAAPALPTIAAQGSYTVNNAEAKVSIADMLSTLPVPVDPAALPEDLIIQPKTQWKGGVVGRVPLVAPSAWATATAARRGAEAAEVGATWARQQADAGLIRAAWGAAAAAAIVEANAAAVEGARAHQDSARRRVDAGLGTELDVLASQTELARREREALAAVADLDAARRALGALLDMDGPVDVTVPDLEALPTPAETGPEAHPEVRAAEARIAAARAMGASATLRHLPTVSASASALVTDVPLPTRKTHAWQVGVDLTWVLFDGGARYGLADQAAAQRVQAEAAARQAALDRGRAIADAHAAEITARQTLRLAETGVRTARAASATASRLYEAGLADSLDVLDAQQRLLDAEVALAGATAAVAGARLDLLLATGQPWSAP